MAELTFNGSAAQLRELSDATNQHNHKPGDFAGTDEQWAKEWWRRQMVAMIRRARRRAAINAIVDDTPDDAIT